MAAKEVAGKARKKKKKNLQRMLSKEPHIKAEEHVNEVIEGSKTNKSLGRIKRKDRKENGGREIVGTNIKDKVNGTAKEKLEKSKSSKAKKRKLQEKNEAVISNGNQLDVELTSVCDEYNDKIVKESTRKRRNKKSTKAQKGKSQEMDEATISSGHQLIAKVEGGIDKQNDSGAAEPTETESQWEILNGANVQMKKPNGKSRKAGKKKQKDLSVENKDSVDKSKEAAPEEVYVIPSGDGDSSRGMKKWVMEYYQKRPGLTVLQERIDDFITSYEVQQEQERKEREARLAEGGWTVVVHHKGRKKTTDSESGVAVGSASQVAILEKLAKKKGREVEDFYRFQKREAQRSELAKLQSKFELDKKRIQQHRAARKFKPY